MQRRPRDDEALARVYGKRAALALCGAVAMWFIGASVAQILPAVFGAGVTPLTASLAERKCAEQILPSASGRPAGDTATDAVAGACAGTPAGLDAWAAFERLRTAEDQLGGSDPAAVARLRRELWAHLPAEMR